MGAIFPAKRGDCDPHRAIAPSDVAIEGVVSLIMGTTAAPAIAAWQNEFESESLFFENEVTQMAQKVHIVLVDDLDGSEASESVSFGLDGTSY